MTPTPTRGWRTDLPLWLSLLIFAAGLLLCLTGTLLTLPVVLVLLWAAPPFGHLADKLSLNAYAFRPLRQGARLLLIYAAGYPLFFLWILLLKHMEIPFSEVQPAAELLQSVSGWRLAFALTMIIVIVPLTEEILFRRLLYDLLARLVGSRAGIVLTAVVFSAIHFFLLGFPILFVCGLIFQLAYLRSGSLAVSAELHMLFNLIGAINTLLDGAGA